MEFLFDYVRFKNSNPHGTQIKVGRFQHHMIGYNGGVNVCCLFAIIWSRPCFFRVGTYNDCQWCMIDICRFFQFCKMFFRLEHQKSDRLKIGSRRCSVSGSKNFFEFFFFYIFVCIISYRISFFSKL